MRGEGGCVSRSRDQNPLETQLAAGRGAPGGHFSPGSGTAAAPGGLGTPASQACEGISGNSGPSVLPSLCQNHQAKPNEKYRLCFNGEEFFFFKSLSLSFHQNTNVERSSLIQHNP